MSKPDHDEIIAALPASARALAAEIGVQAALEVMLVHGGGRLYVPKTAHRRAGGALIALFGRTAAVRLVAARGGLQFDVPNLGSVERLFQAHALAADRDAGCPMRQTRRTLKMGDRTASRRLKLLSLPR